MDPKPNHFLLFMRTPQKQNLLRYQNSTLVGYQASGNTAASITVECECSLFSGSQSHSSNREVCTWIVSGVKKGVSTCRSLVEGQESNILLTRERKGTDETLRTRDFQETETLRTQTIKRQKICAGNQENETLRTQAVRRMKLCASQSEEGGTLHTLRPRGMH